MIIFTFLKSILQQYIRHYLIQSYNQHFLGENTMEKESKGKNFKSKKHRSNSSVSSLKSISSQPESLQLLIRENDKTLATLIEQKEIVKRLMKQVPQRQENIQRKQRAIGRYKHQIEMIEDSIEQVEKTRNRLMNIWIAELAIPNIPFEMQQQIKMIAQNQKLNTDFKMKEFGIKGQKKE